MRYPITMLVRENNLQHFAMSSSSSFPTNQYTEIGRQIHLRRVSDCFLSRLAFVADEFFNVAFAHAAAEACPDVVAFVDFFVFAVCDVLDGHFYVISLKIDLWF
jgi:hypothetical protein